jgi:hypothetical protein
MQMLKMHFFSNQQAHLRHNHAPREGNTYIYAQACTCIHVFSIRGLPRPEKKKLKIEEINGS